MTAAAADRALLQSANASAVRETVYRLDQGTLRVAEKAGEGWIVHSWIQQAINLYFAIAERLALLVGAVVALRDGHEEDARKP